MAQYLLVDAQFMLLPLAGNAVMAELNILTTLSGVMLIISGTILVG